MIMKYLPQSHGRRVVLSTAIRRRQSGYCGARRRVALQVLPQKPDVSATMLMRKHGLNDLQSCVSLMIAAELVLSPSESTLVRHSLPNPRKRALVRLVVLEYPMYVFVSTT